MQSIRLDGLRAPATEGKVRVGTTSTQSDGEGAMTSVKIPARLGDPSGANARSIEIDQIVPEVDRDSELLVIVLRMTGSIISEHSSDIFSVTLRCFHPLSLRRLRDLRSMVCH